MSRWTYKTETVTAGANSVACRGLTHGERVRFAKLSRDARDGKIEKTDVPGELLKMGLVDVSAEDLDAMPPDLIERAMDKILELSGLGKTPAADEPEPDDEKKADPAAK